MRTRPIKFTKAWLPFLDDDATLRAKTPDEAARLELDAGLKRLGDERPTRLTVTNEGDEYSIRSNMDLITLSGGKTGLLYGAYRLLMELARTGSVPTITERPAYKLRMLNHWDNMDGTVERGYAGRSLFFEGDLFRWDAGRLHFYARMLASVGINVVALNNVNVSPPADRLISQQLLPDLVRVADILRIYGIRLLISVGFAAPLGDGLKTADPLSRDVEAWWREHTDLVYQAIPDLAGYLVKADSELQVGPQYYGRTNVEGANMLARALAPYEGVLIWRCFVYNCLQDWRRRDIDRPCAAYDAFVDMDGAFDPNVILQIKNGPSDFQVREPLSPLLLAVPRTRKALEVQLTQEYTGQQIDLYYMQEAWREVYEDMPPGRIEGVGAVTNLGRDENWAGNDLALSNLYAYGRMAWNPACLSENLALEWAELTFNDAGDAPEIIASMLRASRKIYQQYASPLGLGWMVEPRDHYHPSPEGYEYSHWGTYLRATRDAVGVDRTSRGTGLTKQYPEEMRRLYDDPATCPDDLLLFFHRLPYDFIMKDGRTLLQRIYDDHFEGERGAEALLAKWESLSRRVPEDVFNRVRDRLVLQVENAKEWRDVVNTYFYRLSGVKDKHGRVIHE